MNNLSYELSNRIVICNAAPKEAFFIRNGVSPVYMTGDWSVSKANTNQIAYMGANSSAKPTAPVKRHWFETTPGSDSDFYSLKETPLFIVLTAKGEHGRNEIAFSSGAANTTLLRYPVRPGEDVIVRSGCFLAGQVGVGIRGYVIPEAQMHKYMNTGLSMAWFYGNADIWVEFKGDVVSNKLAPNQTCLVNPAQLVMMTKSVSLKKLTFLASDRSVSNLMAHDSAMLLLEADNTGGEYFLSTGLYEAEEE
ncbi:MAG: AIM24 family protein [Clostridiales bacterium]|nr:AIM24 family protein [Clostridiales bacterium]